MTASVMSLADARAGMERAMATARAGDHTRAQADARSLAAAYPHDVNLLHQAGVVLQLGSAYEEALRFFREALEVLPNFHYTEMEIANTYLAMNRPEDGIWWYLKAARSAPTYTLAYRRAGETLHAVGRHAEALQVLQQARAYDPQDPQVAASLAELLIFHNRRADAAAVYETVIAAARMRPVDQSRYLKLLSELADYTKVVELSAKVPENPRSSTGYEAAVLASHAVLASRLDRLSLVAAAKQRQESARWLAAPDVVARLRAAIENRSPLSLIRVGDGEARFLAYCDPRLRGQLSAVQVEMLGDVPFRNWFGLAIATADPNEVMRLQAAVITAVEQADILGAASADRLATDNLHFGYLGHLEGLLSSITRTETGMGLTDAFVHLDIHRLSPFYRDVLAGLDFLGVISPHPGLARRLARLHNIGQFAEYLIPGESRLPDGSRGRHGRPHFPDVYHELYHRIAVPHRGAVFLVAGGLLAKIYCNWIRQRGGIAIDIGSIADGWMGLNTRPGYLDKTREWSLPPDAAGPT